MTDSKWFNFAACSVAALSSGTMLLLLWRFPIPTSIASIVFLGFLVRCVRFASWVDIAADSV
jgi:hypothetical protein